MKGISFIFLFLASLLFYQAQAQELTGIDPRIQEVYRDQMQLLEQSPQRLNLLNQLLEKRVEIIEVKAFAGDKEPLLSSFPLFNKYNSDLVRDTVFNLADFNILKYDIEFFGFSSKHIRIDNTDYMIVIKSQHDND